MKTPHYSIVIPFRNEEKNLEILLPILANEISRIDYDFEVILVDDFSKDNSAKVSQNNSSKFANFYLIQLNKRSGQTGAFKKAFEKAKGKYIIRMDADLQDDPRDLNYFIEKFEKGYDLIVGLRECRKHRRLLRIASNIYDLFIIMIFDTPLHSNSGSYIGFKSDLVKNIPWMKNDHRYLPLIAIRRGAKKVGEVIVRHQERIFGESKYKPFKKIIFGIPEVILFIIRLNFGRYDIKI